MKTYKALFKWGALLLVICWIGYSQLLYPKVAMQLDEVEQAIEVGERQFDELSNQLETLQSLTQDIKILQLECEGTKRILPPPMAESQWISQVYKIIGKEAFDHLTIRTLGKEVGGQRIEITGIETIEGVTRLLGRLRQGRRMVQIESLNLEALTGVPLEEKVYMELIVKYEEDESDEMATMELDLLQGMIGVKEEIIEEIIEETGKEAIAFTDKEILSQEIMMTIENSEDEKVQLQVRNRWEEKSGLIIEDIQTVEQLFLNFKPNTYQYGYEQEDGAFIALEGELLNEELIIKVKDERREKEPLNLLVVIESQLSEPINVDIPEYLRGQVRFQWEE